MSNTGNNLEDDTGLSKNLFLQEAIDLQKTWSDGLTRLNRLIELAEKFSFSTDELQALEQSVHPNSPEVTIETETIELVSVPAQERYNFHGALVAPVRVKSIQRALEATPQLPTDSESQLHQFSRVASLMLPKMKNAGKGSFTRQTILNPVFRSKSVISFSSQHSTNSLAVPKEGKKGRGLEVLSSKPTLPAVYHPSDSTHFLKSETDKKVGATIRITSPLANGTLSDSNGSVGLKWDVEDYIKEGSMANLKIESQKYESQRQLAENTMSTKSLYTFGARLKSLRNSPSMLKASVLRHKSNKSMMITQIFDSSEKDSPPLPIPQRSTAHEITATEDVKSESIDSIVSGDESNIRESINSHKSFKGVVLNEAQNPKMVKSFSTTPKASQPIVIQITKSEPGESISSQTSVQSPDGKDAPRWSLTTPVTYYTNRFRSTLHPPLPPNTIEKETFAEKYPEFTTLSALVHWLFLCPGFDDKGEFIPFRKYHDTMYHEYKFFRDGFHEQSLVLSVYNVILLLFYLIVMVYVPFEEAYYDTVEDMSDFAWLLTAVYALDAILNILTPEVPSQKNKRAARAPLSQWWLQYLKTNLLIDIVSVIPWILILPFKLGLLFSLFRLVRLFRIPGTMSRNPFISRLNTKIENIQGIGNMLTRIIPVSVAIVMFVHVQACTIYFAGKVVNFPTWNDQFQHWTLFPGGLEAANVSERYVWMLTQALGNTFQITFKPETIGEQVITMLFIVAGALLYAYLVGLISSAAISFDASGRLYRQKIDELTDYLNWKNIDGKTKRRLLEYYEFKYRGKYFEEKSLLNDMNSSLRMELATFNCSTLIEKVPFLKRQMGDGRDNIYLGRIATALNPVFYIPGDFIVIQGEQATEMFFIQSGKVNIVVSGKTVTSFTEGAFFGEVALIANIPRTATVQAATSCQLYSLSAKDFNSIILEFDDMKQRIDQIYHERMERVRQEQAARIAQQIQEESSFISSEGEKAQNPLYPDNAQTLLSTQEKVTSKN
ncbi:hypothetical protein BCR33DRAFT_720012 [Rhizoclosmatium globosum]|uniref:Cyclic nucleotide-binding domain-containing protein n=1 Tax=Rhizoclosmatium globosum TaxID=329046 RepID=A0A1Y2BXP7_9FUNG|nr:hypothetical protein BCR33DRAFT_720012 [Rhizoclosmatium globosum]|eukprot:ORY39549.1 hypothetical protein BCR33DRAFT_720012 [Rhizoclosmatium globosum]